MIRIIERGAIEKKRCESCGCLFSYEKEDIEHNTHCDFGVFGDYEYIICPQCKSKIKLGGVFE
jgi:hypothetical protein